MQGQRVGSTRIIKAVERGVIALGYTNAWSAFDRGASPQLIPGIGAARCACAVRSFNIADSIGIPNHYIEQVDPYTIHVYEYSVPRLVPISGNVWGRVLDAEWIWRARVAGSLLERINSGEINPVDLGFAEGATVTVGMKLPRLVRECTTKFELIDRHLTDDETQARIGITPAQWQRAWEIITSAVVASNNSYEESDFYCLDGKLEIGMDVDGEICIVDVFGTPDENRIIDAQTGEIFSKDIIRDYLKTLPWKRELDIAKMAYPTDKSQWPAYPTLPDDLVELVSKRYVEVALRYAGVGI